MVPRIGLLMCTVQENEEKINKIRNIIVLFSVAKFCEVKLKLIRQYSDDN
jgi:hypothetical protein